MNSLTDSPLTVAQLETAAADLRNAALVVEHVGHTRGRLVSLTYGTVCALGAIELATSKRLAWTRFGFEGRDLTGVHRDAAWYRCDNAVKVFAEFVPSGLCEYCDDEAIERHMKECPRGASCLQERETYDKVTHYNDAHCTSGDLLTNMLGLAAGHALDAVHERRSLLVGDRIPVPA